MGVRVENLINRPVLLLFLNKRMHQ